jgi:hypothetical protein
VHALVEVGLGRGLNPVGVAAEVHGVQVVGDDLVFRLFLALYLYGDEGFLDLARDGLVL